MSLRSCGSCTKCCEGSLSGEALGYKFYTGKPCHYVAIGKGCTVYTKRPKNPCVEYKCIWLQNLDIPEWMKPNEVNAIINPAFINEIPYIALLEAGQPLRADVLSWTIQYAISNKINFLWEVNAGRNWLGSPEFIQAMSNQESPTDKFAH